MVKLVVILALILPGCVTYRTDPECGYYRTEHGENITQHILPVVFKIHKDVPIDMYGPIKRAAQTYNNVLKEDLITIQEIDEGPIMPRLDGVNVIYYGPTDQYKYYNNIGLADINFRGNKITNADITINSQVDFNVYDLESLMLHEFGHTLGLGHTNEDPESTMSEYTHAGEIKRKLSTKDIINIRCGYL